jgi:hypothetical protein
VFDLMIAAAGEPQRMGVGRSLVLRFAVANKNCVLANAQPASSRETACVPTESLGSRVNNMFGDTTITWDASSESVALFEAYGLLDRRGLIGFNFAVDELNVARGQRLLRPTRFNAAC